MPIPLFVVFCLTSFPFLSNTTAVAGEKVAIGPVEVVVLLPWKARLPARIDTGAATSSVDAKELEIKDNVARFKLRDEYGGQRFKLPVLEWRKIRTGGGSERRPVVMMDLCLGPKLIRTQVTLKNRSHLKYPFLVGRRVLKHGFIVDVNRSKITPPSCPEVR